MIYSEITAGEPFEIQFRVKVDPDTAKNLTGYSAKVELRDGKPDGDLLQSWAEADPELVQDDAGGTVTLTIPAADTGGYDFRVAFLDLLLSAGDDGIRSDTVKLTIDRGVTQ